MHPYLLVLGLLLGLGWPGMVLADITSNLVLHYDLNTGSGTTATDRSGNGLDGTLQTAPALPTWVTTVCVPRRPLLRGCLSFDGDDWVSVPDNALLNITGALTLAVWAGTASATNQTILGFYNQSGGFEGYGMRFDTSSRFAFWDSTAWIAEPTGTDVVDGTLHHLVVSVTGTTATYYLDGVATGTATVGVRESLSNTRALGAVRNGSVFLTGTLDEVRVYSRALSASDVIELYRAGLSMGGPRTDD